MLPSISTVRAPKEIRLSSTGGFECGFQQQLTARCCPKEHGAGAEASPAGQLPRQECHGCLGALCWGLGWQRAFEANPLTDPTSGVVLRVSEKSQWEDVHLEVQASSRFVGQTGNSLE